MGTNHTYRYINATAVYSYGYSAGSSGKRKAASGHVTLPKSGTIAITTGFKPDFICYARNSTSYIYTGIFNRSVNANKWIRMGPNNGSNAFVDLGTTYDGGLVSIQDTGFTLNKHSSASDLNWFAMANT